MKLGIFTDVVSARDPEELAARTRDYGFDCVQLRLIVPGIDLSPEGITERDATRVRRAFEDQGIEVAALAAYTNLTHPDPAHRQKNVAELKSRLHWARALGTRLVATETGTFNRTSEWDADPYNDTEHAWKEFLDILEPCVREAEATDTVIALEAYVENVMNSAARARAVVEHFGPEHVQLVMDPNNYFTPALLKRQDDVLRYVFEQVGHAIALAHAKDVLPVPDKRKCDLPRAGTGVLNWPLFISLLKDTGFDGALVIEHLKEPDIEETRDFVRRQMSQ